MATFAVALMLAVAVSPALASDQSTGATNKTANVDIGRGMTWSWTPTFNLPDTVVSVYASATNFMSTSVSPSKYSQTSSGYTQVSEGTATMQPANGPGFDVSTTLTVGVSNPASVDAQNYTVYAIEGTTKLTAPAFPTSGTVTTTVSKNGGTATSAWTSYIGLTISATTGKITEKPTATGTYVFHQTLTGTSAGSRDITAVVEEKVARSNTPNVYSVQGTASTFPTAKTAGPANVTWAVKSLSVNGVDVSGSGSTVAQSVLNNYGLSVDANGNLKTSASTLVSLTCW